MQVEDEFFDPETTCEPVKSMFLDYNEEFDQMEENNANTITPDTIIHDATTSEVAIITTKLTPHSVEAKGCLNFTLYGNCLKGDKCLYKNAHSDEEGSHNLDCTTITLVYKTSIHTLGYIHWDIYIYRAKCRFTFSTSSILIFDIHSDAHEKRKCNCCSKKTNCICFYCSFIVRVSGKHHNAKTMFIVMRMRTLNHILKDAPQKLC